MVKWRKKAGEKDIAQASGHHSNCAVCHIGKCGRTGGNGVFRPMSGEVSTAIEEKYRKSMQITCWHWRETRVICMKMWSYIWGIRNWNRHYGHPSGINEPLKRPEVRTENISWLTYKKEWRHLSILKVIGLFCPNLSMKKKCFIISMNPPEFLDQVLTF